MTLRRRDWLNVGRLSFGSFAAMAISLLFLPLIARMFGPATLGIAQSYAALLAIVIGVVTLRYELAVMVSPPAERLHVIGSALWVVAAGSAIVFIAGIVLVLGLEEWLARMAWPAGMALLLGVSAFIGGVALIQQNARMAGGEFGAVAVARLVQVTVASAGAVLLGFFHAGWESLVLAALAGSALQLALGGRPLLRDAMRSVPDQMAFRQTLMRYRDFPTVNLPANLLNNAASLLPTVLIAARFGPEYAAYFALGSRLFDVVLQPVSSSLGSIYLKGLTDDLHSGGRLLRRFFGVVAVAAAISGAFALLLIAFGHTVISLLLGAAFLPIVAILPWIAAWRFVQFVNQPVSLTYTALRRQRVSLVIVILFFVPRLGCILVPEDFMAAVQAYSLASIFFYAIYGVVAGRLLAGRGHA